MHAHKKHKQNIAFEILHKISSNQIYVSSFHIILSSSLPLLYSKNMSIFIFWGDLSKKFEKFDCIYFAYFQCKKGWTFNPIVHIAVFWEGLLICIKIPGRYHSIKLRRNAKTSSSNTCSKMRILFNCNFALLTNLLEPH